MEMYDVAD